MFPDDLGSIAGPRGSLGYGNTSFEPATDGDVSEIVGAVAFLDEAGVVQLAHTLGEETLESQPVPGKYVFGISRESRQDFFGAGV